MNTENTINRLSLKALLLAEITRLKFGSGYSLANPKLERIARHNFAAITNIRKTSSPSDFIKEIGNQYRFNKIEEDFIYTLKKFGLDAVNFK